MQDADVVSGAGFCRGHGRELHAHDPIPAVVRSPWFQLTFTGGYLLLSWFAWILNRREVKRRVEPRIAELEKLRADLRVST